MIKIVPNLISFLRVPAGYFVAIYAINNRWDPALSWAVFGATTDFVDGPIARKLNATSEIGRRYVDPFCDFAFALGVLTGFAFYNDHYGWRLGISVVLVFLTLFLKFVKEKKRRSPFQAFAYGFLPLVYCACAVIFFYFYLSKALSKEIMDAIRWTAPLATAVAIWLKRDRFRDWIYQSPTNPHHTS